MSRRRTEGVQVGRTADADQVAGVGERRRDRDRVGRLTPAVDVEDDVEDGGVHRPVEVVGLEDLDDVGDGVLGEQHAAEDALLGGDVLGRGLVELAIPLRRWLAPAGAWLCPHVVGDRHGSPLHCAGSNPSSTAGVRQLPSDQAGRSGAIAGGRGPTIRTPRSETQQRRWTSLGTTCGSRGAACAQRVHSLWITIGEFWAISR